MNILSDFSLKSLNTFQVDCRAKYYVEVKSEAEIQKLIASEVFNNQVFILGGGSNVLFTKDFEGLIIHPDIKGIEVDVESSEHIILKIGAGEIWEELVDFTVKNGWSGIENLAAIPGSVGAAPIQNIGAYGVELKDVFHSLTAIDLHNGTRKIFQKQDCNFDYRNSIFKTEFKNRYIITTVCLRLNKNAESNIEYEALSMFLENAHLKPGLENVYRAIINIRGSKLPDPKQIGNVGSFFKNPVVEHDKFAELKSQFPEIKYFPQAKGVVKLAAAWLIESCGWKGKRIGQVGVHDKQALVLVNHGGGNGSQILSLSNQIIESVIQKFEIQLEPEVNIL
ncbi:MAG: UDP-N-acetylenolpyruvoylglucosamine reductase [Bacteroidetes bacterium HGW-Bacteroidetes-17]|jgi:UDP-N-acetylmuramate dehydrogenase|nr:MAG: UDP-N-acetylenolpyruvoylglucosamine reductase [Bacteroidetes bacterium HGW-Bacteroidetes-17]